LNLGALPIRIPYNLDFSGQSPAGARSTDWTPIPAEPGHSAGTAHCLSRIQGDWSTGMAARTGNYHGLDYALFYMNIRENAQLRVDTWLNN
jgi:hypothetical protein